jgi:glycerol-3-phosphate acyltransferase PlsY
MYSIGIHILVVVHKRHVGFVLLLSRQSSMIFIAAFITASFLIGSIPFGYVISKKAAGIDIQSIGSGNIGSTNVGRFVGRRASLITQCLDITKGLLPTLAALLITSYHSSIPVNQNFPLVVAMAAVCGHDFTPWLAFRGGKGVNTTLGATILLAPASTLASVLIYFIVVRISRYVALGSLGIGLALPIFCWIEMGYGATFFYTLLVGALIFLRHTSNIRRLIAGIEDRKD